ncbi:hypothetical protein HU200_007515 [Digitaria exilis]|uniref:Uncharacterized protein n=1 Tax=Digitaria exilis TaxID=1010633 RepID=A0A835FQ40_9POAL|nr:hypothetical protein HU200_007515 [Digitaria exilis]
MLLPSLHRRSTLQPMANGMSKKGVPHLVVYTTFFYFSVAGFVLRFCVNVWFLYRPLAGVPKSTIRAYINDWNGRHWALLAGFLCGFANGFQFMGGKLLDLLQLMLFRQSPSSAHFGILSFSASTGGHQGGHISCLPAC